MPNYQGDTAPTQRLHACVSGRALSGSRDDSSPPRVGGRAGGWDPANHAPGSAARLSRDHASARGHIGPPTPAPGHAEAGSSVAPTPAVGATNIGDGGENITRTFLNWADIRNHSSCELMANMVSGTKSPGWSIARRKSSEQ